METGYGEWIQLNKVLKLVHQELLFGDGGGRGDVGCKLQG
jgi:hypothetical protein